MEVPDCFAGLLADLAVALPRSAGYQNHLRESVGIDMPIDLSALALTSKAALNEAAVSQATRARSAFLQDELETYGSATLELIWALSSVESGSTTASELSHVVSLARSTVQGRLVDKWCPADMLAFSRAESADGEKAIAWRLSARRASAIRLIGAAALVHDIPVIKSIEALRPDRVGPSADSKSLLQEHAQDRFSLLPTYRLLSTSGPDHERHWKCAAVVGPIVVSELGRSADGAYHSALGRLLRLLGGTPGSGPGSIEEQVASWLRKVWAGSSLRVQRSASNGMHRCALTIPELVSHGTGSSKKAAEREAAADALRRFRAEQRVPGTLAGRREDFAKHEIPEDQLTLLADAQENLGYQFRRQGLLSIALIHPSVPNEVGGRVVSYAVLAALGSFVTKWLAINWCLGHCEPRWDRGADSGRGVSQVLSTSSLAEFSRDIGLRPYLVGKLASGPTNDLDSVLSQVYQAVVAAGFLDLGSSRKAFLTHLAVAAEPIARSLSGWAGRPWLGDPKTTAQEVWQATGCQYRYEATQHRAGHRSEYSARLVISMEGQQWTFSSAKYSRPRRAEADVAAQFLQSVDRLRVTTTEGGDVVGVPGASIELVRTLFRRFVSLARRGSVGWRALARLGVLGADTLVGGSAADVAIVVRRLATLTAAVKDTVSADELLAALELLPLSPSSDPREALCELATAVRDYFEAWQVEADAISPLKMAFFEELLRASALAGRIGEGEVGTESLSSILDYLRFSRFKYLKPIADIPAAVARQSVHSFPGLLMEVLGSCLRSIDDHCEAPTECYVEADEQNTALTVSVTCPGRIPDSIVKSRMLRGLPSLGGILLTATSDRVELRMLSRVDSSGQRGSVEAWLTKALVSLQFTGRDFGRTLRHFGTITHDLKNLLVAIDMRLSTLNAGSVPGRKYAELAAIEDLRVRAKDSATQALLLWERLPRPAGIGFDLRAVLASFVAGLLLRLPKNVYLATSLAPQSAVAQGDPELLASALENLCKNAIEAMSNSGTLRIEWVYDSDTRNAIIEVTDTGGGIAVETVENVRRDALPRSSKRSAPGLGLISVAYAAQVHGGEFDLSNTNDGTRARLIIPAVAAAEQEP